MDTKELKKELTKLEKKITEEVNRISTAFDLTYVAVEFTPMLNNKQFRLADSGCKIKVVWDNKLDIE